MRYFLVLSLVFFTAVSSNAQILKGKVYDATSTIENIKVFNETQNRVTATDKNGNFSINAKVNDTILFESLFYHPKAIVLKPIHFEDTAVFELKKILTELDEVEVMAEPEQPEFEVETYNVELQNLILEDIKRNPHLYQKEKEIYGGVDFVALIGMMVKLLKKKDKYVAPTYQPITYTQMDSLFEKSSFFNKQLLTENLKIPEDKKFLFYDFCEAKYISSELLKDEHKMQLLEELVLNSQLFNILLEQYGEKTMTKD